MSHSRGPFAGVRIIELANSLAAPGAAAVLADQGADVIKVEPPGVGDILRYIGASRNGISGIFEQFNRGKRSIALNLKDPEGQAILQGLVRDADVVLHNFRPGVAERIGAGYAQLKGLNPGLIYATLTGFGTSGPYAGRPAYDNVVQAFAGIAYSQENAPAVLPGDRRQAERPDHRPGHRRRPIRPRAGRRRAGDLGGHDRRGGRLPVA